MAIEITVGVLCLAAVIVACTAVILLRIKAASDQTAIVSLSERINQSARDLSDRFASATIDMAERLEKAKGDLRQETSDRIGGGFRELTAELGHQLGSGREEQAKALKLEISALSDQTRESLEAIRREVNEKLQAISGEVQQKLNENIREGFLQFEKVQQHLKAAEEQLRNVGAIGASINDLNNLLKMPHLRGRFGEASLERLLADFLPASMYELQAAAGDHGRADAVIKFPGRILPIDAKFPREQVLPLFESSDPAALTHAREEFARVIKEQAKRIAAYIRPENGTTDMALMYLPSETLYMEAVMNGELSESLNKQRVFPVSPNTMIVTLHAISMVFKMYEFAKSYEAATEELRKAQQSFAHFENRFEDIGSSLGKAQQAYEVARGHLTRYRNRVTSVSSTPVPELGAEDTEAKPD